MSVQADGQTASFGRSNFLGQRTYHATLPGVTNAGVTVTVGLKRGSGDTSAPGSSVQLPTAIVVSAPAAGSSVSRAHALGFKVDSTAHDTRIEWSGSCVEPGSIDLDAGAPLVVPAGRVVVGRPARPAARSTSR